jgi:hypothetical protein
MRLAYITMLIYVKWLNIYQIPYEESTVWTRLLNEIQVKQSGLSETGIYNDVKYSKLK